MRKTYTLVQLAIALMNDPSGKHWGYQLSKASGIRSGVMYPLLTRMLQAGWLEDGWEDADPSKKKRPPRRYYTLTNEGRIELGAIVQEAKADRRFQLALPGGIAVTGGTMSAAQLIAEIANWKLFLLVIFIYAICPQWRCAYK